MRRIAFLSLLGLALAVPARAQGGPGPMPMHGAMPGGHEGMMMMHGGPSPAEMLLAHTGELRLTDAQVVRLAAIARRAAERHQALHARMMAEHQAPGRQPSDADMQRMHQAMEQEHEQMRTDLRDALAVLTPDQQATAFEQLAAHVHGPGGMHPMGPGADHMRMGPGGPDGHAPPPPPGDARP
jgi:hypothetical protein